MEMQDAVMVTPTIIERWIDADHPGVVDVPALDAGRALLVFVNPEEAETFRSETGRFPSAEGFEVETVDLDGIETIAETWGFGSVALRGLEPDTLSFFGVEDFIGALEEADDDV